MGNDESKGEIGKVLGSTAAPLEEAKADVMGVWNMLYKVDIGHWTLDIGHWTMTSMLVFIKIHLYSHRFCLHLSEL